MSGAGMQDLQGAGATIVAAEGDTVDYICWRHYGATANQVVEQVLAANPGLADRGARLPAGVQVRLPVIVQPALTKGLRLWD